MREEFAERHVADKEIVQGEIEDAHGENSRENGAVMNELANDRDFLLETSLLKRQTRFLLRLKLDSSYNREIVISLGMQRAMYDVCDRVTAIVRSVYVVHFERKGEEITPHIRRIYVCQFEIVRFPFNLFWEEDYKMVQRKWRFWYSSNPSTTAVWYRHLRWMAALNSASTHKTLQTCWKHREEG